MLIKSFHSLRSRGRGELKLLTYSPKAWRWEGSQISEGDPCSWAITPCLLGCTLSECWNHKWREGTQTQSCWYGVQEAQPASMCQKCTPLFVLTHHCQGVCHWICSSTPGLDLSERSRRPSEQMAGVLLPRMCHLNHPMQCLPPTCLLKSDD